MKYRLDRDGNKISALGFGLMRLSKKGNVIDYKKAEKEVLEAIDLGINYFDTAYIYPNSEECFGNIISNNNIRDKFNIATKLPQYVMRSLDQIDKTFNEELTRLKTDYIDYYLMHMFTDYAEFEKLKSFGIEDWFKKQKENKKIRYIGFSYHGDSEMFIKILNAYDWDFCQIQYNYLDEHSQAGKRGLDAAYNKGIPVMIMEPLRGGKLVNLPKKALDLLAKSDKHYSAAELGLRWLWNQKEVTCVLSGMNSLEMIKENAKIASSCEINAFDENDYKIVEDIKKIIKEREKVPCTGCHYCMPCPQGVDIPSNFHYYNLMYIDKKNEARFEFARGMGMRSKPGFASQCIGCGKCEKHCPQKINIREKLKKADRNLRPLPFKIGIEVARKIFNV